MRQLSSFGQTLEIAREMLYAIGADRMDKATATHPIMYTPRAVRAANVRGRLTTLLRMEKDLGNSGTTGGDDSNRYDKIYRIRIMSYGIDCTWGLLRHVYMLSNGSVEDSSLLPVEIHAGMSNYDGDDDDGGGDRQQQLMYSTVDYYGRGRCEGYVLLCEKCATSTLRSAERKNDTFCLPFNNCDTIVPFVYQTPLMWFALLYSIVGLTLATQTFNVFVFAMFVPSMAFLFTAFYNRAVFIDDDRTNIQLQRCGHIGGEGTKIASTNDKRSTVGCGGGRGFADDDE